MKKQHILLASILLSMPYTSFAQQITGFEEEAGQENYTKLGVYDSPSGRYRKGSGQHHR